MEKILNSVEELYRLITGTLPEGYIEHVPYVNWDRIGTNQFGTSYYSTCYFTITDVAAHDRVKIEYSTRCMPIITNGRIYKYA